MIFLINNNKIDILKIKLEYKKPSGGNKMRIILDAMGGDNAPDANIKGAINAINKVKAEVVLVGKEDIIRTKVKEFYGKEIEQISDRLKIVNSSSISTCFKTSSSSSFMANIKPTLFIIHLFIITF